MSVHQTVKHTITNKLREAFTPESLDVTDESHLHEGHAGHRPGGETHFRVYIVSTAFEGKSRIERHRMINAMLAAELAGLRARAGDQGAGAGGSGGLRAVTRDTIALKTPSRPASAFSPRPRPRAALPRSEVR